MAKILDALREGESNGPRGEERPAAPRRYQPDGETEPDAGFGEEVPFIEVGGPRKMVQASAAVLAAAPARERTKENGTVKVTEGLVEVSFQPLPAAPPQLKPACERFAAELVAFHQPEHPVSEQYRILLAGLESQLRGSQSQVLFFTAALPRTGATTVLLNLALTRAIRGGIRVALVDANLPRPALAERLGVPASQGLCEILAGALAPQRALRVTGQENLDLLASGKSSERSIAQLDSDVMRSLMMYLRGRYDLVLVDGPCWDDRPEVAALGGVSDAVYLVLPQGAGDHTDTRDLVNKIPQQGGRLRGCILTHRSPQV